MSFSPVDFSLLVSVFLYMLRVRKTTPFKLKFFGVGHFNVVSYILKLHVIRIFSLSLSFIMFILYAASLS